MNALLSPLKELADYEEIIKNRNRESGTIQITGCVNSQKTHLMYALSKGVKYNLVVFSNEEKAKQAYEEYKFLDENTYYYPARDLLFYHADIKGKYLQSQRMEVIRAILECDKSASITVITTMDAFLDGVIGPKEIETQKLTLLSGDVLEFGKVQEQLVKMGYERETQIESPGQFAVRGGILDVFPLTDELPVRIELWGDEIDSIRTFDAESQRSIENLEKVTIYPTGELITDETKSVSFLEYFNRKESLLLLDEPIRLLEQAKEIESEYQKSRENRQEAGMEESADELLVFAVEEIIEKMNQYSSVAFTTLESKCGTFHVRRTYSLQTKGVNPYNNSFEMLTLDLKRLKRNGYRVILLSGSRTRARRLAEDLRDYELSSYYSETLEKEVQPGEILVTYGHVTEGYEYPMLKFVVISESDIFGRKKKKRKKKHSYEGQKIRDFTELKVGDYVVHENHGLGVYEGIEKIQVDKVTKDYMKIRYAGDSALYILATQLDMIQKYAGSDAKKPKLNKLGTAQWQKTKSQVRSAVKLVAKDLVELYAARQRADGYVYEPDTVWQKEFEEMFPFEETEDQLQAIEDTKHDMESHKIMDRLICGDVGFGKTEIAIRAAFKAVQEGKQVVYLVPTTILAQQHYNNFVQRMKEFPVRVDLLCRFRTSTEQKKTIEDLKKGLVDIVIGTHRVLSKDVQYKDLGLLIIDEEQRFGVTHKEKIKKLRENIDVLTLTATPIPRTLHMSLIGIRDMSVLEEAPMDRMPIQTYVMEYNDEMVREAIERELARNGQVYYVYNRVSDIADVADKVQKLVPDANVMFAHGQMNERQLEDIMYDFINGEIDVLISTTIIETGLDISNANTMIIHDADRLGLSQLYQLRGRVGRSNRMAYAFLLYRRDKLLKEVAEKRLAAIREFTELGSGFKIAMRDLEIRGAGNLLGAEQHGHMEAVGYDLYCKMLNEAVKQEKGEMDEDIFNTTIDLNVDAYIPDSYISNEFQKLDIYKRIASIENEEEMDDMLEELIDRFGDVPRKVQQLLHIALLKAFAHSVYVTAVEQKTDTIKIVMYEKAKVDPKKIPGLLEAYHGNLVLKAEATPYFLYQKKGKNKKEKSEDVLELVKKLLNDIKTLLEI
ncbi:MULTISPECIES: transcription-repair coupling factor [Clostridia]|uniref:transcription-repair coupling factor n=1 Tax=Clostridia TaxID=186801 RepID=UPI000E500CC3|nr:MULTISPECIES: transcription-repair coupling factor [Clostridia]RGH40894.1 transcription-repair coupling factor [Firmicutes bacterium AM41-5BH]RKQ31064.1 transcription-repair coupling factor [Ruminococcus sp. B05]TAP34647.1 transcription-repair coupling factor [Mediterraneibacter sp. gm002]